ncbi:MAG: hypothetical protein ACXVA9_03745 [Bdellovibrionales bacterium]
MRNITRLSVRSILGLMVAYGANTYAIDVEATATALRLANTITGGFMPSSDPLFLAMVTKIQNKDIEGAAAIASSSKYAASYLARRLAFQMQNPSLEAAIVTDSDATAFVIAHLVGTPTVQPSISTIWSENATYLVNVGGTQVHAASLSAAQLQAVDWTTALVQMPGQQAQVLNGANTALGPIPAKHVGGYVTLSDRANDNSFAMYGATSGTNLRMIEGIWEIGTGMGLLDVASPTAVAQDAPRFVPEYDSNFFHGQGQTACIACHGGGMSSLNHGYSTVADVFDYDPQNGFTYIATPSTSTMKSLGSDPNKRQTNVACNLTKKPMPVCNPDSAGADINNGWDLTKTWQATGALAAMGWTGPTTGQGLNELGSALGKAKIVYEFLTKRIVGEICPMGIFSAAEVAQIAASANPNSPVPGTDDVRTLISKIASHVSCQ